MTSRMGLSEGRGAAWSQRAVIYPRDADRKAKKRPKPAINCANYLLLTDPPLRCDVRTQHKGEEVAAPRLPSPSLSLPSSLPFSSLSLPLPPSIRTFCSANSLFLLFISLIFLLEGDLEPVCCSVSFLLHTLHIHSTTAALRRSPSPPHTHTPTASIFHIPGRKCMFAYVPI